MFLLGHFHLNIIEALLTKKRFFVDMLRVCFCVFLSMEYCGKLLLGCCWGVVGVLLGCC